MEYLGTLTTRFFRKGVDNASKDLCVSGDDGVLSGLIEVWSAVFYNIGWAAGLGIAAHRKFDSDVGCRKAEGVPFVSR
jgi:hypothetical protein